MCVAEHISEPSTIPPINNLVAKSRKRLRRVSFDADEIVRCAPTQEACHDSNELWYQHDELVQFKDYTRDLCRKIRNCSDLLIEEQEQQPVLMDSKLDHVLQMEQNCCARGLESRVSMERQRNKYLATRAIIKAQQRYENNPEQLASLATKCTAWAKEVALCTGYQDYCHAYNPSLEQFVPKTMSVKFPSLLQRKRRVKSSESPSNDGMPASSPSKRRRCDSSSPHAIQ